MKILAATLGGIVAAAQISTACFIAHPGAATDIGLTGAGGAYLLWSVPLGVLFGVFPVWLIVNWPRRTAFWPETRKAFLLAFVPGFLVAPIAPGMLGLGPHSTAQLWQSFEILSIISWLGVVVTTQVERHVSP